MSILPRVQKSELEEFVDKKKREITLFVEGKMIIFKLKVFKANSTFLPKGGVEHGKKPEL